MSQPLDLDARLAEAQRLLDWLRQEEQTTGIVSAMAARLATTLRAGGRILACGNGGSMSDSMHFAEELTGRNRRERPALAAQAISDPGHLTCVANDYGYEQVFARGVEAWARSGDALVVFSTSGQSRNVVLAAEAARARGVAVIGFLGRDGGAVRALCDLSLVVPGTTADRIQEVHIKVAHLVIDAIEADLFP